MLTSKQRAYLRSKASAIDCIFQVGKGGVNENMLKSIDDALTARELIKLKCLENCEYTPREACDGIAEALDADGVQVIGNKFVLFRISPEHRKYDLEKLCELDEKKEEKKKPAKKPGTALPMGKTVGKPYERRGGKTGGAASAGGRQSGSRPSYVVTKRGEK